MSGKGLAVACSRVGERWRHKHSPSQLHGSCQWLGTGYFIWGGQALFGFPKTSPEVNKTMGMWGFWMPGFMQFITGVYLLIGLTWFNVFGGVPGHDLSSSV
jgi:hypothetical protein